MAQDYEKRMNDKRKDLERKKAREGKRNWG